MGKLCLMFQSYGGYNYIKMGNCTPKASLNYQGNYQEKFNKNGTLNYETHGTNVAENGSCCNKDNTLRNYPSNRKGRVE